MPFQTSTESEYERFADFEGDTVVLVPTSDVRLVQTQFKDNAEMIEVTLYRLEEGGELSKHPGVSIWSGGFIRSLEKIRAEGGDPLAGVLGRQGRKFVLQEPPESVLEALERAWAGRHGTGGRAEADEPNEPF